MKCRFLVSAAALATWLATATAAAAQYDYELGLTYDNSRTDTVSTLIVFVGPIPSTGLVTTSSDSDRISLRGKWFFGGLKDDEGPQSRAEFVSRASSISLAYSQDEGSVSTTFVTTALPTSTAAFTTSVDAVTAGLRYVWQDSGWYALAGISRAEANLGSFGVGIVSAPGDTTATAYSFGVGKYVGATTAIDLRISESDANGFSPTNVGLNLTHIGSFRDNWQYGADIGLSRSSQSADEGRYSLGFSVYPSREFEFGVAISHQKRNGGLDKTVYEGFLSWFVRDNVELTGRYSGGNIDTPPDFDIDTDSFGLGVNVRF